jgi:DNA mismatch repair protein MutS
VPQAVEEEAVELPAQSVAGDRIVALMESVDPDSLTPREALDLVYRLKDESRLEI